mmetsp:Transcript_36241/g.104011  ORF Transcript_36241/g.104011 Transcript_36241/m.104011 type:complete len:248 (+) Transcript_36241:591-1334(+)
MSTGIRARRCRTATSMSSTAPTWPTRWRRTSPGSCASRTMHRPRSSIRATETTAGNGYRTSVALTVSRVCGQSTGCSGFASGVRFKGTSHLTSSPIGTSGGLRQAGSIATTTSPSAGATLAERQLSRSRRATTTAQLLTSTASRASPSTAMSRPCSWCWPPTATSSPLRRRQSPRASTRMTRASWHLTGGLLLFLSTKMAPLSPEQSHGKVTPFLSVGSLLSLWTRRETSCSTRPSFPALTHSRQCP